MNRNTMLMKIRELAFASGDLGLYLDTHPEDEKALQLHKKYSTELGMLKEEYQKTHGALTMHFPSDRWSWIDEPWPWEHEGGNH